MSILNTLRVNTEFPVIEKVRLKLKTINNETVEIVEKISTPAPLEFQMNNNRRIRWYKRLLPDKEYDLLLGMDLLKNILKTIDFQDKNLTLRNNVVIPLYQDKPTTQECYELRESELINLDHLNSEEKRQIEKLISEFPNLFFHEGDQLTNTNTITHQIKLTTDQQIYSKLYRLPPQHEKEVEDQIAEMEKQGIIRKSHSRYASPIVVVAKKPDSSGKQKYRICVDYRKLNEITVDDKFPLPNIDGILDKLGRAQYFTTLDLAKGYHQIRMHQDDIHKTAFITPKGLYEYTRMPFGLKNAPATFQRLMNEILRDFINKICVVYLDDILIFSTSLQEHISSIRKIFQVLNKHNLKIQFDKCSFLKKETEFLGHILTDEGMKPNPNKIKCIEDYPLPVSERQLRGLLGMTGYYRKFIEGYAKLACPMTKYLKKGAKINPKDPEYISAFERLKQNLIAYPILKFPDFDKSFELTTDASNYAIGAVLSQDKQPVCYASRTLNDHERNYSTTDKEFLAIIWAVTYFRPYLWGRHFKIITDHQPIKYLNRKYTGKEFSQRTQRWLLKLQEYQFDIEYLKGKDNKVADFLSRIPTDENIKLPEVSIEELSGRASSDNSSNFPMENHVDDLDSSNFSMENHVDDLTLPDNATVHSESEQLLDHYPIRDTIINHYKTQLILTNEVKDDCEMIHGNRRINVNLTLRDDQISNLLKRYIVKGKTGIYTELSDSDYNRVQQISINLFSHDKELKFEKVTKMARDIKTEDELNKQISKYHTNESLHSGIIETWHQLKTKIYYPKLFEHIRKIINNCERCMLIKYERNPIKPKFQISETPSRKNEVLHLDLFHINRRIYMTLIDKFTKKAYIYEVPSLNFICKREKLFEHFSKFGKPKKIILDNEFKSLTSFFMGEQIDIHFCKPRSHTGNSDIERLHLSLQEKLTGLDDPRLTLNEKLFKAIEVYNDRYHSTIKCTPNEAESVDPSIIRERRVKMKGKIINEMNKNRETYIEKRRLAPEKVFWRRPKDIPRYEIRPTEGRDVTNFKRPRLFADYNNLRITTFPCPRKGKSQRTEN